MLKNHEEKNLANNFSTDQIVCLLPGKLIIT